VPRATSYNKVNLHFHSS